MKKIFHFLSVLSHASLAVSCTSSDDVSNEAENTKIPEGHGNSALYKFIVKNFTVSTNKILSQQPIN